jgi:hypothetical protein
MQRRPHIALAVALAALSLGAGTACRQDMHDTPRYEALEKSDFYADRQSSRPLIDGTVARGQLRADDAFYTGKNGGALLAELPMPLTKPLLVRGQDRFNVYCSPCHSKTGLGDGMVVRRGYKQPPSLHEARLRGQPVGYFYDVITRGFGQMPDYAAQIQPQDRWAVAAYIRALQISQHSTVADVPEAERPKLDEAAAAQEKDAAKKEGTPAHD